MQKTLISLILPIFLFLGAYSDHIREVQQCSEPSLMTFGEAMGVFLVCWLMIGLGILIEKNVD